MKVGEPISSTWRGTVLFATGWTGTYYWDGSSTIQLDALQAFGDSGLAPAAAFGNNADIIAHLRTAGFRTVQVKWQNNWFQSQFGHPEGMGNLACRPATVARWVYDNLHGQNAGQPFCACGHSNGASQVAYLLAQYELASLFSAVVFESGPNWSRIDTACLHDNPAYQAMYGDPGERNTIDWGFGYNADGTGPCAQQNPTFQTTFLEASLAFDTWQYNYPNLTAAFVFGGADTGSTAAQGMYFYDRLVAAGTPSISLTVVPNAPHFVTQIPEGAQAIESTLLNECRLR